jgi:hypothetical protein
MILKIILLILLFACPSFAQEQYALNTAILGVTISAGSSIALVQGTGLGIENSSTSIAKAFGSDVTAGNIMVVGVGVAWQEDAINCSTQISDSLGSTWQTDKGVILSGAHGIAVCSAKVPVGGGANTVTYTPIVGVHYMSLAISEFSGLNTTTWYSDSNATGQTSATDFHHGDVVMSTSGLMVGYYGSLSTPTTITEDGNWILMYEQHADTYFPSSWVYRIVSSGTYNDGWTTGSSNNGYSVGVGYK